MVEGDVIKAKLITKMDIGTNGEIIPSRIKQYTIDPRAIDKHHEFKINRIYKNGLVELTTWFNCEQYYCYTTMVDISLERENLLLYTIRKVEK